MYMYVCIYIYIYMGREREREGCHDVPDRVARRHAGRGSEALYIHIRTIRTI